MTGSTWAVERFGELAEDLSGAVPRALKRAHESASAAQGVSGTFHLDPYGHTLKNRQYECLVEELAGVGGVQRLRPHRASYELVRLTATNVTLLPWRYGTNAAASRLKVRMKPSVLRRGLLSGPAGNPNQMSIEQAELSEAEIDAQMAEDEAVWDQLRNLARVVTIAYSSNPNGIFDLGWGDAELADDDGTINWRHWEPLALATVNVDRDDAGRRDLQTVEAAEREQPSAGQRFDDGGGSDDDDIPLRARSIIGEPQREAEPPTEETGTDEGSRDESR